MVRRRLLWQLYPSYLLIIILCLAAVTWYASRSLRQFYIQEKNDELLARARLVEEEIKVVTSGMEPARIDELCKKLGQVSLTRITVILPDGRVIGDTEEDPSVMENHGNRPEVLAALKGRVGTDTRFSHSVAHEMQYVAVPMEEQGQVRAVVRTSLPITAINQALNGVYVSIAIGGLVIALLASAIGFIISQRISKLLDNLRHGAERFARGEFTNRLPIPSSDEIGGLAEAMNSMAAQLDERFSTILRQRNEQEAVLSSMVEGVLAVDSDERVLNMNQAASNFLAVSPAAAQGRSIQEVIRNTDLQQFITRTLAGQKPVEGELVIHGNGQRFLQAHGNLLRDAQGKTIGALVVLNDITRLRRLENVRREFVANVSHELKTPVTTIKGFVETLQDGAVNNPEEAQRFLTIMGNHADRLQSIIDDLLSLSRIEQEAERKEILLEEGKIRGPLQGAIQVCEVKARAKEINIELQCEENLSARINAPLLEQAVVNLIDNAITYTEPGGKVWVSGSRAGNETIIEVRDRGCGISPEHLPRLFERFYRVDKARSRKLGGTGLGLAIVKHIVQAHGGTVTVESTVGEGSTFTVHLPG